MKSTTHRTIPFCLPSHVDVATFLNDYWQKKPLLIKNGLPDLVGMFEPDDILGLACEEEVSARLITQTPTPQSDKGDKWSLKTSPLSEQDFTQTPKHWTVLVQNLEQWSVELGQLWAAFDFIPKWQQDDIMVSYAPDGGSVGAHFDDYDVFLAQGYGARRWQLGKMCDEQTTFVAGQPIRLLDEMGEIIFDEILQAGDVLYVPPRLAHHGVAVGDCLTFSFGFRRPSLVQVLDKLADTATNHPTLFKPLSLPQTHQACANTLSDESIDAIKQQLVQLLTSHDELFHHAIAELVSRRQYELLKFDDDIDGEMLSDFLDDGGVLNINHASRFIWLDGDGNHDDDSPNDSDKHCYINGELVILDDTAHRLLKHLLAGNLIDKHNLATLAPMIDKQILATWVNDNWLVASIDDD